MLVEPDLDPARAAADQALADALRARLALGQQIGPDAEAMALRELVQRAGDSREAETMKAVMGRLAANLGPRMIASGGAARLLAADRFGPMAAVETAEAALDAAQTGARAIIGLEPRNPWWGRLLARPGLQIIQALPDDRYGDPQALMVSAERPGPTGDDRTFWVTDARAADGAIAAWLARAGLSARPLAEAGGLKLFLIAGYVQAEDGRLTGAPGSLTGVIGAAPVF